jgi:NADPH-dependent 2,4-dienoyl-CoA reductase/sulfur reductase-like enzyme
MSAASRAKRNDPELEVTVLERSHDVSYSACGMPYNIAEPEREIDDLVVRQASVFREKQKINLLTGYEVTSLNTRNRSVSGRSETEGEFTLSYDKLLIATGASPIVPEIPGVDSPGVLTLKSLNDGREIKRYLKDHSVRRVVIIGMGYIALEMCEALRRRDIKVELVKPRPRLLPWMDETLSDVVRREIEENGATLYPGQTIERIIRRDDERALDVVCSRQTLTADMVLLAIGVTPNSQLAEKAGLELSVRNAIAVDRCLRTSDPDIFAAGDCADSPHEITGKKRYIPLALRANRSGWAVADTVSGRETEVQGVLGTSVFRVFDLEIARTGLSLSEAIEEGFAPETVSIKTRSRAHAHPGSTPIYLQMVGDKKTGRLLGVQMVGQEGVAHRINAVAVALHAKMTVEGFSQSDLAYAPPFSPVWDPLLTTANQLVKRMK